MKTLKITDTHEWRLQPDGRWTLHYLPSQDAATPIRHAAPYESEMLSAAKAAVDQAEQLADAEGSRAVMLVRQRRELINLGRSVADKTSAAVQVANEEAARYLIGEADALAVKFYQSLPNSPEAEQLDPAGVQKLPLTVLEQMAVTMANEVKAWCDSDRKTPFPESAHMNSDAIVMFATARRQGVA